MFSFGTIFSLLKSIYFYDLKLFDDDFEITFKDQLFQSLIMYFILMQMFRDILQRQQHYALTNDVDMPSMVTTITIIIIVVFKQIQHNVMQHYQSLVLKQNQYEQQQAILQVVSHFVYLMIWQQYSLAYLQISMSTICQYLCYPKIAVKYVNDESFCEYNTLLYYIITYVIGYPLNHHLYRDEYLYDFNYFVYYQNLIFNQQLSGAVYKITEHDSFQDLDHIVHVSNIQASLRNYISANIIDFNIIQSNNYCTTGDNNTRTYRYHYWHDIYCPTSPGDTKYGEI